MATTMTDPRACQTAAVADRAIEAVRQAAHVTHDARTLASDAVEDGIHAARRAITHGVHDLEDLRDSAAHRVRRAPLLTVGLAVAGGMLFGVVLGWIGGRVTAPRQ